MENLKFILTFKMSRLSNRLGCQHVKSVNSAFFSGLDSLPMLGFELRVFLCVILVFSTWGKDDACGNRIIPFDSSKIPNKQNIEVHVMLAPRISTGTFPN